MSALWDDSQRRGARFLVVGLLGGPVALDAIGFSLPFLVHLLPPEQDKTEAIHQGLGWARTVLLPWAPLALVGLWRLTGTAKRGIERGLALLARGTSLLWFGAYLVCRGWWLLSGDRAPQEPALLAVLLSEVVALACLLYVGRRLPPQSPDSRLATLAAIGPSLVLIYHLAMAGGWDPGLWSLLSLVAGFLFGLMALVVINRIGWPAAA